MNKCKDLFETINCHREYRSVRIRRAMHNEYNNSLRNSNLRQLVLLLLIDLELFNNIGAVEDIAIITVVIIIPLTSIF